MMTEDEAGEMEKLRARVGELESVVGSIAMLLDEVAGSIDQLRSDREEENRIESRFVSFAQQVRQRRQFRSASSRPVER